MVDMANLIQDLRQDEGVRYVPYRDTVGKWTVGVGRNIDDVKFSDDEVNLMLRNDINRAIASLNKYLPWWSGLNEVRQSVLINMCFNMGINGLLGFSNALKAIEEGRWRDAKAGMLQSKWASQVGYRAVRLSNEMLFGGIAIKK